MTVIRPVRPTDLVALVSFDGRVYPNEARACERLGKTEATSRPLESAIEQWFSFATGRHTWISVKGATMRGLVSARRRAARSVWEVDYLINAADDEGATCLGLLEQATSDAVRSGVERVFLRLCADSPLASIARKAGFGEYLTEKLLVLRRQGVRGRLPELDGALRKRMRGDDFAVFQLYNAVVPEPVRRVEGLTFSEWKAAQERKWLEKRISQLVTGEDSRVTAWLRYAVSAGTSRFDLMVHPEQQPEQERLLDRLLARLAFNDALLALVPAYAEGLRRSLLDRGFEEEQEFRRFVRRTAVAVKAAQLAPAI